MLCEDCKIREADTLYIEVVEGKKRVLHLCKICAEKRATGVAPKDKGTPEFPAPKLLIELRKKDEGIDETLACPTCGLTWREFKKVGRLGCPDCYDTFHSKIEKILIEVHGSSRYLGRRYIKDRKRGKLLKQRRELEEKLRKAVENENFEEAARIRDKLRELEEKLNWS